MCEEALKWGKGAKVVFIGDSITDCGRRTCPLGLGSSYVRVINDLVTAGYPQLEINVVNRGISGDTSRNLVQRWQADVLDEAPDWLYISIGINDVWRQLANRPAEAVLIDEFEENYTKMIETTQDKLPDCRIVPMETTVMGEDLSSQGNQLLVPYNQVIHSLAKKYKLDVVPTNKAFHNNIQARPNTQWTNDGVHPNSLGHALMAITVLRTATVSA